MTDWCQMYWRISGPTEIVTKFLTTHIQNRPYTEPEKLVDPNVIFDFDTVIPSPPKLELDNPMLMSIAQYEWLKKHWKTRTCGLYFCKLRVTTKDNSSNLSFKCQCAWYFPEPIAITLTKMYPALDIAVDYLEEWDDKSGRWKNSNITALTKYQRSLL